MVKIEFVVVHGGFYLRWGANDRFSVPLFHWLHKGKAVHLVTAGAIAPILGGNFDIFCFKINFILSLFFNGPSFAAQTFVLSKKG